MDDEIVVNTIGLSSNADQMKLSELANITNGVYFFSPSPGDLWKVYLSLAARVYGAEVVRETSGTITYAGTVVEQVLIDSSIGSATFAIGWPGSDLDLTLIKPDGSIVDPVVALSDKNIEFTFGTTYEFYKVDAPQDGEWSLVVNAISVPLEGEEYFVNVTATGALSFSVTTDRTEYDPGMPIVLTASVEDHFLDTVLPQYILGASIQVEVRDPSQAISYFDLYDDGSHGDVSAGDGIYSNSFLNTSLSGSYNFKVRASGLNIRNGQAFTREHYFSTYVNSAPCIAVTEIPQNDCEALIALYNSTSGDTWTENTNWLETTTPSNWFGVIVSNGHVTNIDLRNNQFIGGLPSELGNFTALRGLLLENNQLSGMIPPELGNLATLEFIFLGSNSLSGSIPPELGNLAVLSHLSLYNNQLTGSIPPELGNLTVLQSLNLAFNQLSGNIPPELGSLTALLSLNLGINQLTSSIPPELGDLANLVYLSLFSNYLTGNIPSELGELDTLYLLDLHNNQLTGGIPLSYINLSQLAYFLFYETYLCEPTTPVYLAWKATIADYQGTGTSCVQEVDIAIQPDGKPASIRCTNEKATIEVAILTTDSFDALTVDHTTVTFEGATEYHVDRKTHQPVRHEEDIDGDGDLDLLFHFRFGDTTLTCDATEGTLIGFTYDGIAIEGTDRIRMTGN